LRDQAAALLRAGWPAIVDAACLKRAERAQFAALAAELGVPFLLLDCQADAATLRQRVRERQRLRGDASEANESVLERQFGLDEPLTGAERAVALQVRTDGELDIGAVAAAWQAARP